MATGSTAPSVVFIGCVLAVEGSRKRLTLERVVFATQHVTAALQLQQDVLDAGEFHLQPAVVATERRVLSAQVVVATLQVVDHCLGRLEALR